MNGFKKSRGTLMFEIKKTESVSFRYLNHTRNSPLIIVCLYNSDALLSNDNKIHIPVKVIMTDMGSLH